MYVNRLFKKTLNWWDVAPLFDELHEYSISPHAMRWPELAWNAFGEYGLTVAESSVDRLDTTLRVASLIHLHMQFNSELELSTFDIDLGAWLEGTITLDEIDRVLAEKYDCCLPEGSMHDAFELVYLIQLPEIIRCLHGHFGSFSATFESLVNTATAPWEHEPDFLGLGSAHDFLRIVFEELCGEKISGELPGTLATRSNLAHKLASTR